ncbi:MAG: phosphotransferase [Thermofilaceae archaeon]
MDLSCVAEELGGELVSCKRLGGLANEAYRLEVRGSGGIARYAAKVYFGRDAKLKAVREYSLYAVAPSFGLGAPKVVLKDFEGRLVGRPLLAWEWIEGVKCEDQLKKTLLTARLVGAGLARFHEIPYERVNVAPPAEGFWMREIESVRFLLKLSNLSVHPSLLQPPESEEVALLHGDYNPGNLLLSSGKLYVMDAESLSAGDPLYDVAYAFAFLWASNVRAAEKFAAEYFALTGRETRGLAKLVRLVALKLYCMLSFPAMRSYLRWKLGAAYPLAELLFLNRFRKLLLELSQPGGLLVGE